MIDMNISIFFLLFFRPSFSGIATEQTWITTTGKNGESSVSWVTRGSTTTSEVVTWGDSPSSVLENQVNAISEVFSDQIAPLRIHVGVISNLTQNQTYYYTVGGNSTILSFQNEAQRAGGKIYAIFGDLGLQDDYALPSLLEESLSGAYDAVIHAGVS